MFFKKEETKNNSFLTKVCALLIHAAKIDEKDNMGQTPLLVAAEAGQDECAILLAKLGANVNATDNKKKGIPERLRGILKSI